MFDNRPATPSPLRRAEAGVGVETGAEAEAHRRTETRSRTRLRKVQWTSDERRPIQLKYEDFPTKAKKVLGRKDKTFWESAGECFGSFFWGKEEEKKVVI